MISGPTETKSDIIVESTRSKCRGTTGSYSKISMNINKGQRATRSALGFPISSLRFSFGPTKRKGRDTAAMTDAILDDVLATMETPTTTTTRRGKNHLPQHQQILRRVSFATKAEVHLIQSRQEISSKEYKTAWYSHAELNSISESCLKQIHLMSSNNGCSTFSTVGTSDTDGDEGESCFMRGLESFTPVAAVAKKLNRSSSVQAVLNEQSRQQQQQQQQHGCEEEAILLLQQRKAEAIRMIYHRISASSQLWAQAVALKDRRVVEDIMMEDECCCDREVSTTKAEVDLKPQPRGGRDRRRRGVSRNHSSNSTNSTNSTKEQPKKRSKPVPRGNSTVTTPLSACRLEEAGTTTPPLDPELASHQRVMALAA